MKLTLAINASAFNLDDKKLDKLKINLKKLNTTYRWLPNDMLHIALINLSETQQENIKNLDEKIKSIARKHGSFELKLNGVQAYPNQEEGRLLWIGVQNSIALRALQSELAHELITEKDFREDKVFKPILPIVRLKNHKNLSDMISPYKGADFKKIVAEQLVLYEMVSGGAFPIYKLLKIYHLFPIQKTDQPDIYPG